MTNNVAAIRKERGFSQQELAEKANISRPYLSIIENNPQKAVTNSVMFRLADALGVEISVLFLP